MEEQLQLTSDTLNARIDQTAADLKQQLSDAQVRPAQA